MSCCGVVRGWTCPCLWRRPHIAESRWGGVVLSSPSRLYKHQVDRKTRDDTHVSPLPKAKKKIMTQLRRSSLAISTGRRCRTCCRSFVWRWQSKSYPGRFRCPLNAFRVKVLYFVEAKPQATDTTHAREVESKATPTKYAIVHFFAWEQVLSKARVRRSASLGMNSDQQRWSTIAVVTGYRLIGHRLCRFFCLPTWIVNEIQFL